jgi:exosome complex RNA-binding protein Csl4
MESLDEITVTNFGDTKIYLKHGDEVLAELEACFGKASWVGITAVEDLTQLPSTRIWGSFSVDADKVKEDADITSADNIEIVMPCEDGNVQFYHLTNVEGITIKDMDFVILGKFKADEIIKGDVIDGSTNK